MLFIKERKQVIKDSVPCEISVRKSDWENDVSPAIYLKQRPQNFGAPARQKYQLFSSKKVCSKSHPRLSQRDLSFPLKIHSTASQKSFGWNIILYLAK